MPTPIVIAYYLNLVLSRRASELLMSITVSEICVCELVTFLLSAVVGGPVRFSGHFGGGENVATRGVFLPLSLDLHKFVQSVGVYRLVSNCTVSLAMAYFAHSRSLKVVWTEEGCVGCYQCNAATGEVSNVPFCFVRGQKRATDGSFNSHKLGEIPARYVKAQSMTISETCIRAEIASVRLYNPVTLHADNIFEVGGGREKEHEEQIWDLQHLTDQSVRGVSALQHN